MKILKKILIWIPALLMMLLIFSFSGENGDESSSLSDRVSIKLIEIKNDVFNQGMTMQEIKSEAADISFIVRKAAHFTEYFILAWLYAAALYVSVGIKGYRLPIIMEGMVAVYATSDELHQLFVAGRAGQFRDVLIDSAGGLLAALVIMLIIYRRNRMQKI